MGVLDQASVAIIRAGADKILQSEAVLGALRRRTARYGEILELFCAGEGGISARVRLRGFSEEVRVTLRRAEIGDDGTWLRLVEMSADREGMDALLRDFVQGKKFNLPAAVRPFAGMLKKLFA